MVLDDTIAAVATPPGAGAARAIVRVSGRGTEQCLRASFQPADGWPQSRSFSPRVFRGDLRGPLRLPCDAYLWPSRRSYTREPAAELHTIGSPPLAAAALRTVCEQGARLAKPGEFTLRAFRAGRLDLTQAEAVLGVIDSQDRRTLDIALKQLAGGLAGPLAIVRGELLDLLADLEAGLDFVEEHIEFVTREQIIGRVATAKADLESLAEKLHHRSLGVEPRRVVITGWPNVGKSSLFNALAGSGQALVSEVAGTTRDYIEARIRVDDSECLLVDTAGFENAPGPNSIAAAAGELGNEQGRSAELRLLCLDATRPLNEWERERLAQDNEAVVVLTKCDGSRAIALDRAFTATSSLTGAGVEELRRAIALGLNTGVEGQAVASTTVRCRSSIERAIECLTATGRLAEQCAGDELVAAETRLALDELGTVTGAIYTDDVLDRVFSRFCIGK